MDPFGPKPEGHYGYSHIVLLGSLAAIDGVDDINNLLVLRPHKTENTQALFQFTGIDVAGERNQLVNQALDLTFCHEA